MIFYSYYITRIDAIFMGWFSNWTQKYYIQNIENFDIWKTRENPKKIDANSITIMPLKILFSKFCGYIFQWFWPQLIKKRGGISLFNDIEKSREIVEREEVYHWHNTTRFREWHWVLSRMSQRQCKTSVLMSMSTSA